MEHHFRPDIRTEKAFGHISREKHHENSWIAPIAIGLAILIPIITNPQAIDFLKATFSGGN